MSHIPAAAMPHAKPHEVTPPALPKAPPLPWAALAAGGVLAIGGAITAAWLLRGGRKDKRRPAAQRSPATKNRIKRTTKPRRSNAADHGEQ